MPGGEVAQAQQRLSAALEEVAALDAELDALSEDLAEFTRVHDRELSEPYAHLDRAESVIRRIRALQNEVQRLLRVLDSPPDAIPPAQPVGRRRTQASEQKRSSPAAGHAAQAAADEPEAEDEPDPATAAAEAAISDAREDEAKLLKRLFRRLARLLHPDLARDDAERERLHGLMAQVNAAYERQDRPELELLADRLGAGEPLDGLTDEQRLAYLSRRLTALEQAAHSLRQQRDALKATSTHRLMEEVRRRAEAGRDYFAETRAELSTEEAAAVVDGWQRLRALHQSTAALSARWSERMSDPTAARGGLSRAFDPVLESALVRRGLERLEDRRASPQARTLARTLEDAAVAEPWTVALTLLAFFAEKAIRPPETLRTQEGWKTRYDAIRTALPDAPPFERTLTRLPPHLELGMRAQNGQLHVGVQVRDPELLAGVSLALEQDAVAELARRVFEQLGPEQTCKACGRVSPQLHLMYTRGLDELHALVCPRCGAAQKRYWMYSRNDGLEALLPEAQRLGLVSEQVVRFGGAAIGFQFPSVLRHPLRATELLDRLWSCYFQPYGVELPRESVQLVSGNSVLGASAPLPEAPVSVRLKKGAGMSSRQAVELLRSRIERRFRPER